ncbi:MAG: hypothetical protein AAGF93_04495 [Cyanobacteria bacterium P01_H01_bin.105]
MRLLCITDPKTHPSFDTTISLYKAFANHKAIDFFHASVSSIDNSGQFRGVHVSDALNDDDFTRLDDQSYELIGPSELDLVFCRADEPVPLDFFQNLGQLESKVRFVNRPSQIAYTRRKDFLEEHGREYLPEHIFSSSYSEIKDFFQRCNPIVAKMNVSYGGSGVFKIWQDEHHIYTDNVKEGLIKYSSLKDVVDHLTDIDTDNSYEFVQYLQNIDEGDKRVFVVDGEIYGALLRKSQTGTWVHNVTAGAAYYASTVTERECEIIAKTYRHYSRRGVYTLGYDFLMGNDGEWTLSEVNTGNIGGYDWHEAVTGEPTMTRLVQWLIDLAKS